MNITNKNNLPEAIVNAMRNDSYNRGDSDFTVTELLKPPRQRALQKYHADEITEDAEDLIYRLYGQIAHSILERANELDLSEKRFFADFQGLKISGQIDTLSLRGGILSDFKFSTVWKFKQNAPPDPEYVAQLNMQLELLRQNGLDANKLQIIGLIRDYRKREAQANPDSYPSSPIVVMPIPMWSREEAVHFINRRILLHVNAASNLPECTKDERWAKDDIYAVMKGKRAINGGLQSSQEQALQVQALNPGTRIEVRPAENVRCSGYCSAAPFCAQFKKLTEITEEKQDAV